MIIPINEHIRISSDALNWIIEVRETNKVTGKLDGWRNDKFYSLQKAGGLRNALNCCTTKPLNGHPLPHPADLEPLTKVVERIEMVEQRILDEYATPRTLRELIDLGIAVEAGGYRFVLDDPYCVQRQVPRLRKGITTWESKNYFNNLGLALVSTLHRTIRSAEDIEGLQAALRIIYETEMALRTVLKQLPEAYFSAEAGKPADPAPGTTSTPGVTRNVQAGGEAVTLEDEPA